MTKIQNAILAKNISSETLHPLWFREDFANRNQSAALSRTVNGQLFLDNNVGRIKNAEERIRGFVKSRLSRLATNILFFLVSTQPLSCCGA